MTRRLAVLFLLAMTGVLVVLGLLAATFGAIVLGGYLVGVTVFLGLMVRRARRTRRQEQDRKVSGRTCTCCTTTVFDPVEIR